MFSDILSKLEEVYRLWDGLKDAFADNDKTGGTIKIDKEINIAIKSNFGFGDLNCCVVLKSWKN